MKTLEDAIADYAEISRSAFSQIPASDTWSADRVNDVITLINVQARAEYWSAEEYEDQIIDIMGDILHKYRSIPGEINAPKRLYS